MTDPFTYRGTELGSSELAEIDHVKTEKKANIRLEGFLLIPKELGSLARYSDPCKESRKSHTPNTYLGIINVHIQLSQWMMMV